jgi:hypothetical protein
MSTLRVFIARLDASLIAWRSGPPLTQEQLAAWMLEAWSTAPAYRTTQPGQRVKALRLWRRAMRVYRLRHHRDISTASLATESARRWSFQPGTLRRSA